MDSGSRKELRKRLQDDVRARYWDEYDRDTYECPVCGLDDVPLDVHHRNGDWMDNRFINLYAVCKRCHRREHARRMKRERLSQWKSEFGEYLDSCSPRSQDSGQSTLEDFLTAEAAA